MLLLRHEVRPCEKVLALWRRIEAREGVGGSGKGEAGRVWKLTLPYGALEQQAGGLHCRSRDVCVPGWEACESDAAKVEERLPGLEVT